MQVSAVLRDVGLSPQKARLVADEVRGLAVEPALDKLRFMNKKAAAVIRKVLESAVANAEHNFGADIDELRIFEICIDQAASLRRFRARAKGRGNRILKRRSHIKVVVSENLLK